MLTTNFIVLLISVTLFISLLSGPHLGPSLLWSLFCFAALSALRANGLFGIGILALSITGAFHFLMCIHNILESEFDKPIEYNETNKEDFQDMGA